MSFRVATDRSRGRLRRLRRALAVILTNAAVEEVDSPEQRDTLIGKAKMDFRPQSEIA
jgi:hypothetical protein